MVCIYWFVDDSSGGTKAESWIQALTLSHTSAYSTQLFRVKRYEVLYCPIVHD